MFNRKRNKDETIFDRELRVVRAQRDFHLNAMDGLQTQIDELQRQLTEHTACYSAHNNTLAQMVNSGKDLELISEKGHLKVSDLLPMITDNSGDMEPGEFDKTTEQTIDYVKKEAEPISKDYHYDSNGYCDNPGRGY